MTQALPDEERIAAIRQSLESLRARTAELAERAHDANAHALETRRSLRVNCQHAAQATEMRTDLEAVERELEGLRIAMQTRGVIEQAKGMLMLQQHCDADTAFASLVSMSQTSHRKLVDVATAMVAAWSAAGDEQT